MKVTWRDRSIDFYFASPIFCDGIFVAIILLVDHYGKVALLRMGWKLIQVLDTARETSYLSSIISTTVALAGFMVAALTIMITVKASLKARGFTDSGNALEYIFTTDRYKEIVGVFMHTIGELIIILLCSYMVWLAAANISDLILSKFLFCATFTMATSIVRSVFIFFKVLKLENVKKQNKASESNDDKQTRLLEEILKKLSEKET